MITIQTTQTKWNHTEKLYLKKKNTNQKLKKKKSIQQVCVKGWSLFRAVGEVSSQEEVVLKEQSTSHIGLINTTM